MTNEREASGAERYVLCEINVSSVSPFPESVVALLVSAVRAALAFSGTRHP